MESYVYKRKFDGNKFVRWLVCREGLNFFMVVVFFYFYVEVKNGLGIV